MSLKTSAAGRPPALQLGKLHIWPPVIQAPMAAVTNLPMRTLAEEHGCGFTVTEFLAAPALAARVPAMLKKLTPSQQGRPFGVQIFGRDPDEMKVAAELAVQTGAAVVDINMGCPAKKVTKGVCGSALMREPTLAQELVCAVKQGAADKALVTVKMRSGWDECSKNAPEFAQQMVAAGASLVTVHGRTRQQKFTGKVDLEIIRRVKEAVSVPVIANGDIVDLASLERTLEMTGADGVMIGRAANGNPWIFQQIKHWWAGQALPALPTALDRMAMFWRHLHLYLQIEDEFRAVTEMRKFGGWYLREMPGVAALRREINQTTTVQTLGKLLKDALAGVDADELPEAERDKFEALVGQFAAGVRFVF